MLLASKAASKKSIRTLASQAARTASISHVAPHTRSAAHAGRVYTRSVHGNTQQIRTFSIDNALRSPSARKPYFDKILIANRGEIACRVIRTAKKLAIRTVAVYSEADKDSMHVALADEAYCIGPAPSAESYLRMDKIIEVCKKSGAQAVHPGYGFLSENATFAEKLAEEGIVFIGPPASAIVSMGSKSESKNIMISAGVPCVPGYHGTNQDPKHLAAEASRIGYPVLIKAIHGGGGKGMRTVYSPDEFQEGLASARREAEKSFGNGDVLVERFIVRPRHIEVQVFADARGNAVSLWERDCSVQRRNQKIIEEAPAPGLSASLRADLSAKAVAAAKAVNYMGAGTVEFIFDNDNADFFFMEMNTRLQVEHPVTEMVTGLDLVDWQLQIAAGNPLPLTQAEIPLAGHAFEARIYAETPRNNFLPDSGTLLHLSTPTPTTTFAPAVPTRLPSTLSNEAAGGADPTHITPTPGGEASLRLEEGFATGAQIGVFYDPMIAKLVASGRDRTDALRALRKGLEEYEVVGLSTNIEFLRKLASHPAFIDGDVETGFIKKHYDELFPPLKAPSAEILAQAALYVILSERSSAVSASSAWSTLTARRFGGDIHEQIVTFQTDAGKMDDGAEPENLSVHVQTTEPGVYDIRVGEISFSNVKASISGTKLSVALNGQSLSNTVVLQRAPAGMPPTSSANSQDRCHVFHAGTRSTLILPAPKWLKALGAGVLRARGALRAPMPSLVVEVKVAVGDKVEKGQAVVVLESMKTETVLRAPAAGVIKAVGCSKGEMVEEGRELVDIDDETADA